MQSIVLLQACRAEKRIQSRKVGHKLTHTCLWCHSGNHGAAFRDQNSHNFHSFTTKRQKKDKYYSSLQILKCDSNRSTSDQLIPADPVWCDSVFNYSGERRKLQLRQTKQSQNDRC